MTPSEETRHTLSLVRALLGSVEWNEFLVPQLQRFRNTDTVTLATSREAGARPTDDFLRGRLDVYSFFLEGLERQAAKLEETLNEEPEEAGQPGGIGDPYLGEGQPFTDKE